jgi:hypothetical protein
MLAISIGEDYLDLQPGTTLEMEINNPYLQFSEALLGETSLPIPYKQTPGNLRKLEHAGLIQAKIDNKGIDAIAWDGDEQYSIGKLKHEKFNHNLNRIKDGSGSLIFQTGFSAFYQDIKDKRLRDVVVGGDRAFAFTDFARTGSNGFWQHLHAVIDAGAGYGNSGYDYAFYPVINKEWYTGTDSLAVDVMNLMEYSGGSVNFKKTNDGHTRHNVIVPFPYLKYVLIQAAAAAGYQVEGDILNDADFNKITLVNFRAIDWHYNRSPAKMIVTLDAYPYANVSFNLQNHLPDISLSQFFLWLTNRFGWWYDFDRRNKIIRIKSLGDTALGAVKDMTKFASPLIPKKITQQKKAYSLRNNFITGFSDGPLSIAGTKYQGTVNLYSNLPAAAEALSSHSYLVIAENNYYICRSQEGADVWEWQLYAPNIYDKEQQGDSEDIVSGATTVGLEKYSAYLDFTPRIDSAGIWTGLSDTETEWGLHMLMYVGKRNNKAGNPVPLAINGIYDSAGVQVTEWSLCFECKKFDGSDVGLYERAWKKFITTLNANENFEVTLHLPRHEYMQLSFNDQLTIDGVRMYIKTIKPIVPYPGKIIAECSRI